MRWEKRGLVIPSPPPVSWAVSHAMMPFVELTNGEVRIYFSGRDAEGRSITGFAEGDPLHPKSLRYAKRPILEPGPVGTFDDSGAMGSCIVSHGGRKYLYYIGWTRGVSVPFYTFVGCAISDDGGDTFRRVSAAPLLERTDDDPFLTTSPWVLIEDDRWRMWYPSGRGWSAEGSEPKHYYVHLRYAESDDGLNWRRTGQIAIDFADSEEYAIARPCVVKIEDTYCMWYAHRGDAYRIGYAESADGLTWERKDVQAGIEPSGEGWDSEMIEYPCVFQFDDRWHMLYNGNGFGATGVGHALGSSSD